MSPLTYLAFALFAMNLDALACYILRVRYRLLASLVLCLFWPISVPFEILGCWVVLRSRPLR